MSATLRGRLTRVGHALLLHCIRGRILATLGDRSRSAQNAHWITSSNTYKNVRDAVTASWNAWMLLLGDLLEPDQAEGSQI